MTNLVNLPPVQDYAHKLMLLEAIRCYINHDEDGLRWIERQMFIFASRLGELNKRDP